MSSQIATLAVKLTASAGAFSTTLTTAGKQLSSFGSDIVSTGTKVLGFGGALAALAGGGSLAYLTRQSMEAIGATARLADRLGATTEGLVGLEHGAAVAGISSEAFETALQRLQKSLGGASEDGTATADVFKSLGLSADQLANMPADEAFKQIAESISKIQNPVERANAELKIFGKAGQQLDGLLRQGAGGIAAAQAEAQKLGITFNRVDAAKVEQANEAIIRMQSVFTGISNQLAIGLAPYIDAVASKFTDLATQGGGIGPKIGGAIEWVAKGIATVTDYLSLVQAGFKVMQAVGTLAVLGLVKSIDLIGKGIVWVINKLPGMHVEFTSFFDQMSQGLVQDVDRLMNDAGESFNAFQRGDHSKAVTKVFDDIKAKSEAAAKATADNATKMGGAFKGIENDAKDLKKVSDTLAELQKDVSQFGLSDSQKKLADLQGDGATADQITQAKQLLAVKDQLETVSKISTDDPLTDFAAKMEKLQQLYAAGKVTADQFQAMRDTAKTTLNDKLTDQAKSITEDVKTPLEKYQDEIAKLNTLFERGLITQDIFNRATLKAKSTLETADAKPAPVAAIQAGSATAMKLAFESTHGVQSLTKDDVARKQLTEAVTTNRQLDQAVRYLRDVADAAGPPQEVDI